MPAITSVGKCTYKYSLENAINDAVIMANGVSGFNLQSKTENAAANDEEVCPDGNEKSVGFCIIISAMAFNSNGRGRAVRFFNIIFENNKLNISDSAMTIPVLRCFLVHSRMRVRIIQSIPADPRCVIKTITASRMWWRMTD